MINLFPTVYVIYIYSSLEGSKLHLLVLFLASKFWMEIQMDTIYGFVVFIASRCEWKYTSTIFFTNFTVIVLKGTFLVFLLLGCMQCGSRSV